MPSRPLYHPERDRSSWAKDLGVSIDAIDAYLASDVIDLHIDSFIWTRIFDYDLHARHSGRPFPGWFMNQADFPRIREAEITGGIWSITTNPFRSPTGRTAAFSENFHELVAILERTPNLVRLVRTLGDYKRAKASGAHAVWIGVQGGNAFEGDPLLFESFCDSLVKVTLVHLLNSVYGTTSSPMNLKKDVGLTAAGAELVGMLNAKRVFVDLAHISRKGFFEAVEAHDKSQPLLVSHTGVNSAYPHWRNLDDEQLRAVADTGGVIGVMYQSSFLGPTRGQIDLEAIVDHLAAIVNAVGDDFAALGSDWDGMIVGPKNMPTCLELPRLAQAMLNRGWTGERIGKILGGNFLRALGMLRP
ncbi:MAG: membrane dipeptidase [Bdellovibrionales bacterium]|nr:membrane dipeptidase [Bdellovibrionales bacterium]